MEIVLSSDACAILIDPEGGCLLGIRDLERKVSLVDPAVPPRLPFDLHDPAPVRLTDARLSPTAGGSRLRLTFDADGLELVLRVSVSERSVQSLWSLEARNRGRAARSVTIDFPVIEGTGGPLFSGGPGFPAPWAAVADPTGRAGLGVVVHDRQGLPKDLVTDGHSLRVRYASPLSVPAGRAVRLPETALLVSGPDWRPTARAHAAWSGGAPHAGGIESERPPREWLLALRLSFPGAALRTDDPVDASLAGIEYECQDETGDQTTFGRRWQCALASARSTVLRGEVCDDPRTNDPAVAARMFRTTDMDAIVLARLGDPDDAGRLADYHAPHETAIPVRGGKIPEVAVCDLEDLSWQRHIAILRDGCFRVDASSNWLLCLVLGPKLLLAGFDPPADTVPGGVVLIRVFAIAGIGRPCRLTLCAPGLIRPVPVSIGDEVRIPIPRDVLPGWHPVWVEGRHAPRFMRFLRIRRDHAGT